MAHSIPTARVHREIPRTFRARSAFEDDRVTLATYGQALMASAKVTGILGEMMRALAATIH